MNSKSRRLRPLAVVLIALGTLLVLGVAIAIPTVARANHKMEMRALAAEDATALEDAQSATQRSVDSYAASQSATASFVTHNLQPAHELVSGQDLDLPTDEVAAFDAAYSDIVAASLDEFEEPSLAQIPTSDELAARYTSASKEELTAARAEIQQQISEIEQYAEEHLAAQVRLEELVSDAVHSFAALVEATSASAGAVLADNPKAKSEVVEILQALVESLDQGTPLPGPELGTPATEIAPEWLRVLDGLSKYPTAAADVVESHKKESAPKPKPQPTTDSGSGSGGGSGTQSGGQCTWMEWGPVAPYWVWGPCSEMPGSK